MNEVNLPNLPKLNPKKVSKRRDTVDDEDDDNFDRQEKGMPKGRSQAELVKGKDVVKKRLVSQN